MDVVWKVFGDPSNQWMLWVMLAGLVGTVIGPWLIIRAVARPSKSNPDG